MYKIISNSRDSYGIKAVVADTVNDLKSIPIGSFVTGSNAFVFETSQNYILNFKHEWVPIDSNSSQKNNSGTSSEKSEYTIVDGGNAQG